MSHFCGYLLREHVSPSEDASTRDQLRRRVAAAVDRSQPDSIDVLGSDSIWVASSARSEWPESIYGEEAADSFGVVAGASLWPGSERKERGNLRSESSLLAALLEGRIDDLSGTAGSFAAVAWCGKRQILHLATDKLATRCLYYRIERDKISFSTSLRLLRIICEDPESASEAAVAESLFLGQPLSNRTPFEGVFLLLPGETVSFSRTSAATHRRYFDYRNVRPIQLSRSEALEALHEAFSRAIARRMHLSSTPCEAFLSGGMDSRAVVAELVDQGRHVSTFCTAYRGSIDDVVSSKVARHLGCDHQIWHRSPAERIRTALDPFAIYARNHFQSNHGDSVRHIWSGDGGSVMMGHVYLTQKRAILAEGTLRRSDLLELFPALHKRPTRQIDGKRLEQLRELAIEGLLREFDSLATARPDKRLLLYYALNDQTRHLYHHFESLDLSRIELLTPFFDSDLVSLILSLPTDWFIDHAIYNEWIQGFKCGAGSIYWQPYRGHIPGPHPAPVQIADQWDNIWYSSKDVRKAQARLTAELLATPQSLADHYIDRKLLAAAGFFNRIGIARFNYEVSHARNMIATFS